MWGSCGAGISSGIFLSILLQTTPLSEESWGHCNRLCSESLLAISEMGGPRCCKRDSYTAIRTAVSYVREHFDLKLEMPQETRCRMSWRNRQCQKDARIIPLLNQLNKQLNF